MVVDFEFPIFGLERASCSGMNTSRRAALFLGFNRPPKLSMGWDGNGRSLGCKNFTPFSSIFYFSFFISLFYFSLFPFILFSSNESF